MVVASTAAVGAVPGAGTDTSGPGGRGRSRLVAGHACAPGPHWRPRRGGRSFELSATAAPAARLRAGGGGAGEAAAGRQPPWSPGSTLRSGLCLVSTWLPRAGDGQAARRRRGRRRNGGEPPLPGAEGGCGSGKPESALAFRRLPWSRPSAALPRGPSGAEGAFTECHHLPQTADVNLTLRRPGPPNCT